MQVLIISLIISSSLALRRVSIGLSNPHLQISNENDLYVAKPDYVDTLSDNFKTNDQQNDLKTSEIQTLLLTTTLMSPTVRAIKNEDNGKMKQINVKPRGGKHIKNTYQNLVPYAQQLEHERKQLEEQQNTEVFGDMKGNVYTKEELEDMCVQAEKVGSSFGIKDITSFAGNNCGLIQLYYSNVSCEEIGKFVEYCETSKKA